LQILSTVGLIEFGCQLNKYYVVFKNNSQILKLLKNTQQFITFNVKDVLRQKLF